MISLQSPVEQASGLLLAQAGRLGRLILFLAPLPRMLIIQKLENSKLK